jgi:hypothetical protein
LAGNKQLPLSAYEGERGWRIPFASRIVVIAPRQNCERSLACVGAAQ